MLNVDEVEPSVGNRYEVLNDILLRASFLASTVECAAETQGLGDIYEEIGQQLEDIRSDLHFVTGIQLTYNGEGFVPFSDGEGRAETAFAKVRNGSGVINDVYLVDPADLTYTSKAKFDHDDDEDEDDGGIITRVIDPNDESAEDILSEPTEKPRLYLEILTGSTDYMDQYVGGIAVRASDVRTYNVMDLLRTTIELVDDRSTIEPLIDPAELPSKIQRLSHNFYRLMHTKPFRRASARQQRQIVEETLYGINNELRLDSYGAYLEPKKAFFVIGGDPGSGDRKLVKAATKEGEDPLSLVLEPLRVDTLDMFDLCAGRKISTSSSMQDAKAGLYIVAVIKQGMLEIDQGVTDVVWIPVSSQELDGHFYHKVD